MDDDLQRLDPRAVGYWRIAGILPGIILGSLLAAPVVFGLSAVGDSMGLQVGTAAAIATITLFVRVVIAPPIRWRIWAYRVTDDQLFIQRGFLVIRRTLIPLARVQNVDTAQGPIARRFGLSEVSVATAAGTMTIPALADDVAEALRDRIAELARLARDDD